MAHTICAQQWCFWCDKIFWAGECCLVRKKRKESLPYLVKDSIRFDPVLVFLILKYQTGQSPDTLIYMLDEFFTLINGGIYTSVLFNTQEQPTSVDPITRSFNFCFLIMIVSFSNLVGHKQLSPKQQSHCLPRSLKSSLWYSLFWRVWNSVMDTWYTFNKSL